MRNTQIWKLVRIMAKILIVLVLAATTAAFDPWEKDHHGHGWGWRPGPGWGHALGGVSKHVSSSAAAASAAAIHHGHGGVSVSSSVGHHQGHSASYKPHHLHPHPHYDPYFPGYHGGIVSYPGHVAAKKKGSIMDALKDYFHGGYPGSFGWRYHR